LGLKHYRYGEKLNSRLSYLCHASGSDDLLESERLFITFFLLGLIQR